MNDVLLLLLLTWHKADSDHEAVGALESGRHLGDAILLDVERRQLDRARVDRRALLDHRAADLNLRLGELLCCFGRVANTANDADAGGLGEKREGAATGLSRRTSDDDLLDLGRVGGCGNAAHDAEQGGTGTAQGCITAA